MILSVPTTRPVCCLQIRHAPQHPCRTMQAFNLTEDESITAMTVGGDFVVNQVRAR